MAPVQLERAYRPQSMSMPGVGWMPGPVVRLAATKAQLGIAPTDREVNRLVERQRLETEPAMAQGGEGMDAPDLAVRRAAAKVQMGVRPSDKELRRLERQRLEAENGSRPGQTTVTGLLAGSRPDPNGTWQEQEVRARRRLWSSAAPRPPPRRESQRARNAQLEQEMRSTGQIFYTDPYGDIQPVIEAGTNRAMYHPSDWEDGGQHPKTGEPTLVKWDKYGQRQYKAPRSSRLPT